TRSQAQKELDELIAHVSEKTYAYGAIRAENQNLLFIISELKTKLKNVKKDFTCQQSGANLNVIAPGMYKVVTPQESQTHNAKSDLSSTGINAASSVRRSMNRDSHDKNSVLANSKNSAKQVAVYVRKNNVGQFCDGDLEVAFRSKTCNVGNLEGDDLLTGGRESNLYNISISDMAASSPVCLMSKAILTKSWLWHYRLSHLNFGTINDLTRLDLVNGLPNFK
nr:integrase, catalytic region, zinc finger, CCHC-type, peptidase aspartic, catalytic [Tanacetum cinerariifolium]